MLSDADATIVELAPRLAAGELTADALLGECLERIAALDPALHAMLTLDPRARGEARARDAEARAG
ncbi:hypothetical protein, partial [Sphingomonas bacterium]|uniref:hypothetical protein n=1 Tax=Sphingomonas bacterium TaxID=1895847 RepID=UPI001C2CE195